MSMKDLIANNFIDPFTAVYQPAGLTEVDYKEDLLDDIPIVSFSGMVGDTEVLYRVPLNYVSDLPPDGDIVYRNKAIVLDLGILPEKTDLSIHNQDLAEYALSKYGVFPQVKEVEVGPATYVAPEQSAVNELVRINSATQRETNLLMLAKMRALYGETLYKYRRVSDCFVLCKQELADALALLASNYAGSAVLLSTSLSTIVKGSSFVTTVTAAPGVTIPDGTTFIWSVVKTSGSSQLFHTQTGTVTMVNGKGTIYHYVQSPDLLDDTPVYIGLRKTYLDTTYSVMGPKLKTVEQKSGTDTYAYTSSLDDLPIGPMAAEYSSDPAYRNLAALFYS